ncbi:uncharacterized protein [Anabrus simplex]|uniref:uncharacterized protein n=1 Tax=Anabrus simplex TaxID=316456 RepID=UPI0035A399B5
MGTQGPCPNSMELAPGITGEAECRCPPGSAQTNMDSPCYPLFTQGPCQNGSYLAPIQDKKGASHSSKRWGICQELETCAIPGHLFWPQNKQCYKEFTRGPCPKGELLVAGDAQKIPQCRCEASGQLAQHYWPSGQSCHEHYTRGPCLERGNIFLPGGICGCSQNLPHYHIETRKCYQLGGTEPCPPGHQFVVSSGSQQAACVCKESHILWSKDGSCYRQYTQGPCTKGNLLLNSTNCIPLPCRHGRLYFPENNSCYKVGIRGPCPEGQIVLFENSVRPSVDGISYRGMCGCPVPSDCQNVVDKDNDINVLCDSKAGLVQLNGTCHALYSQGPCPEHQWLVPEREGKLLWNEHGWRRKQSKVKCECRPGYKPLRTSNGEGGTVCQPPTVTLASFRDHEADLCNGLSLCDVK